MDLQKIFNDQCMEKAIDNKNEDGIKNLIEILQKQLSVDENVSMENRIETNIIYPLINLLITRDMSKDDKNKLLDILKSWNSLKEEMEKKNENVSKNESVLKNESETNRVKCPLPSCGCYRASKEAMKKHLGILEGQEGKGNCQSSYHNKTKVKKCYKQDGNKFHLVSGILENIDRELNQLFK